MSARPFITPTYQTNLNLALREVIIARNEHRDDDAWTALETLYVIAPKKVRKEVQKAFEHAQSQLMIERNSLGSDLVMRKLQSSLKTNNFLRKAAFDLLMQIKDVLEEKGYLESKPKDVMSNIPKASELFAE
jgi:hypothetical protein